MANYTCILLDADDTLLDFHAAEQHALSETLAEASLPHDAQTLDVYHRINKELWTTFARGEIGRAKLLTARFERFLKEIGAAEGQNAQKLNACYEEHLAAHAELLPGALDVLDELAEVATLGIVSNGTLKVQQARIEASGIDRYMDGIFISEKLGVAKPSPRFFELALRELGVTNKARVLVVGDDLLADVKGGSAAGLDTCWVNFAGEENTTGVRPVHTIRSYEELYKIVMEPEELENVGNKNRRHMADC